MEQKQIIQLIKSALQEVAPGKIGEDEKLPLDGKIRDHGIDSVASMEMIGVLEEEIGTTFPDAELQRVNTFGDVVELVQKHK